MKFTTTEAVMENVVDVVDNTGASGTGSDNVVDGLLSGRLSDNIKSFEWDYTAPVNIATLASSVTSLLMIPQPQDIHQFREQYISMK